jgi:hypothetical protein
MFVATGFNQQDIVKDGLVLWLDANDKTSYPGTGTTWRDLSRSYNIGTLTNGPTYNSANGGSIVFDGVDDFVTGSNSPNFAFGTGDFTVSYWAYINAFSGTGTPTFVDLRTTTTGTGPGYSDYIEVNKFKLYLNNATVYTSTGSLSIGNWYNISVTRQSTTLSVYFNGILDGTSSNNTNLTENGFRLARNINTVGPSYLNGRIASILIYKGNALSQSEITQNFNALRGRFGL